jgi:hypoxanthine phosphoribosyltransferase
MVYGYETNKEFIDKSYQLLEKLENKNLWNKDTLIIGLDKSVRPLAYTLRKLSKEEGRETPEIRFFNYSYYDYPKDENFSNKISKKMNQELSANRLSKIKNVVVLDEYAGSGRTLEFSKETLTKYFSNRNEQIPKIFLAPLNLSPIKEKRDWIYSEKETLRGESKPYETGIEDKYSKKELSKQILQKSVPIKDKETRQKFLANRSQLSSDIKQYLHEKHPEKVLGKSKGLENIISGIFIFSFLVGLFLSSNNLTGNVIGSSGTGHKLFGMILVLVGIGGFFVYRKLK